MNLIRRRVSKREWKTSFANEIESSVESCRTVLQSIWNQFKYSRRALPVAEIFCSFCRTNWRIAEKWCGRGRRRSNLLGAPRL